MAQLRRGRSHHLHRRDRRGAGHRQAPTSVLPKHLPRSRRTVGQVVMGVVGRRSPLGMVRRHHEFCSGSALADRAVGLTTFDIPFIEPTRIGDKMTAIQQPVVEETAVQRNPAANAAANTARNFATRPMTGEEYIASLQDGREIYLHGERVTDVTTHPAFRNPIRMVARLYDALHTGAHVDVLTTP